MKGFTSVLGRLKLLIQTTIMDNKWTTNVILFVILNVCNITMHVQMGNIYIARYSLQVGLLKIGFGIFRFCKIGH